MATMLHCTTKETLSASEYVTVFHLDLFTLTVEEG